MEERIINMKILAIDDKLDNLIVIKAILKDSFPDASVYTALNGHDGLKLALAISPDVILLDIVMPDLDGFETCRRLKENERLKHIPIVFLTALKTNRENRIKALEVGAEAFLSKPIDEQELYAQVRAMAKIKAAAEQEKSEKERLEISVSNRTIELAKEIDKRKKKEQELRESEERYKLLSNLTSDYAFENEVLKDGSIGAIWTGGSFEKMTGYPIAEFEKIGGWRKILHPDDIHEDDYAREKLFKNQNTEIKVRIHHKNGRVIWVRVSAMPVWDNGNNRLKAIIGSVKEVTEEKMHQQLQEILFNVTKNILAAKGLSALFASVQKELNKVINARNFCVYEYDEKTKTLSVIFGEGEKSPVTNLPLWISASGLVIKQKKPLIFSKKELLELAETGKIDIKGAMPEIWMGVPLYLNNIICGLIVLKCYIDPNAYDINSLQLVESVANEISIYLGRKKAETERIKLSQAVEQSPVDIVITNTEGVIEFVNHAFTETSGYSLKEAVGQNLRILKTGKQSDKFYKKLWDTILNGETWKGELYNRKKNGELYWVNAVIAPLLNEENEITHFVATEEDITLEKKMLDDLVAAKEKAQESDRLKTAFLQNISHELRTPLNGILGFSQLLGSEDMDVQHIQKYAAYIESSGNRLLGLISNILDLSKIESGAVETRREAFSLNRLLNEIYLYFAIRLEKKGIKPVLQLGLPDEKSLVVSDESQLNQVIMNLMDNAVKFTTEGKVVLTYEITSGGEILFKVQDTGFGIASEHQSQVFEHFYQADNSFSRGYEGAGLGLPIARGLVENLGGHMWLESVKGEGTCVYFTIPNRNDQKETRITKDKQMEQSKNDNLRKHILIVEDDDISFYFLKVLLKKENYEILHAFDGAEAVAFCESRPDIDLVLMDIKMAGMNGLEATKKIKLIRPDLPIIAQTAYAFSADRDTMLEAGCDGYLTKPIQKNELLNKMHKFI